MNRPKSAGGWHAIRYTLRKSKEVGGILKMWRALRSKNACKTCAVGMGGQKGGMVNERGRFPEVCKKSLQAMAADLQSPIPESFWSTYSIEQLKKFTPRQLEYSGRLHQPLLYQAGQSYYRPISWDEAIRRTADKLKEISPAESFWYFSGRSSNEAGFLLQLFARIYGTNNVNNCSYYCHQASGVGLTSSVGSGTATVVLDDIEHADLVFVIGGNPPSNHPRIMTSLMHVRRRGGKVVVINPVRETGLLNFRIPSDVRSLLFGSEIASTYLQPHIGGDLALLTGIAKAVLEKNLEDRSFLTEHCSGSEEWLQSVQATSWEELEAKSGISQASMEEVAEVYGAAKNVIFSWTMGITHHAHGVQNVQAIANLALMRGMVGRANAGLLPIRGHSNVQGIGSVGVTPKLKDAIFDSLVENYSVTLPTDAGLDTLGCMDASFNGSMKFGLCLGGNLYGSNPDADYAAAALEKLELMVMLSTTLNTGHAHGLAEEVIVFPVLARDEESQATTQESMFNYVRLSDGGQQRFEGARSEVDVIADVAQQVVEDQGPVIWQDLRDHDQIRKMIGDVVPGYSKIKEIATNKNEFQIDGRTFHQPNFGTADGRAQMHCHQLPDLRGGESEFRLMTVRSEGQFNTVVYEEEDYYRGQERRDVILMHPADLEQLGLKHDQLVTVQSETGTMTDIHVRSFADIRSGNVLMYYPEANKLVPRHVDEQSKTPAFKGIVVSVTASQSTPSESKI